MFILTSFGYFLGHGNFILITLGIDLIVTNILVFLKKKEKCNLTNLFCNLLIFSSFENVLFLPVYWKPFLTGMPGLSRSEVREYYSLDI